MIKEDKMAFDKKELAKLSPEERIKRLRLMEEDKKKEFDEIEKLIKDSMQELRTDKLAGEIAPEQRTIDISRLFEPSGEKLERTAMREAPSLSFMKGTRGYNAIAATYQVYTELKVMAVTGNGITNEQRTDILERLNTAERYMTESERAVSKLDASRATLYKLKKETGLG